jgi:hypothetical protein
VNWCFGFGFICPCRAAFFRSRKNQWRVWSTANWLFFRAHFGRWCVHISSCTLRITGSQKTYQCLVQISACCSAFFFCLTWFWGGWCGQGVWFWHNYGWSRATLTKYSKWWPHVLPYSSIFYIIILEPVGSACQKVQ